MLRERRILNGVSDTHMHFFLDIFVHYHKIVFQNPTFLQSCRLPDLSEMTGCVRASGCAVDRFGGWMMAARTMCPLFIPKWAVLRLRSEAREVCSMSVFSVSDKVQFPCHIYLTQEMRPLLGQIKQKSMSLLSSISQMGAAVLG